jgi:hypothetical protein
MTKTQKDQFIVYAALNYTGIKISRKEKLSTIAQYCN